MQANERTGSEHNIQSEKTCMLYEAHTNCSKQASFSKLLIIQLKIKILSEGLWQQILYQNLRNLSNYWSV